MELELGLGLGLSSNIFQTMKAFDLNGDFDDNFSEMKKHKRNFEDAFEDIASIEEKVERKSTTLPLLVWSGQPNEDEDDHGDKMRLVEACHDKNLEEENELVGWPPIKSWRKQIHENYHHQHQHQGGWMTNDRSNVVGGRNSKYVKVKMVGVTIGRKVDLSLYDSYQALIHNLVQMFARYQNYDNNSAGFTLLYQDKEGKWMLPGDVPWQNFMENVQRIEIVRNGK